MKERIACALMPAVTSPPVNENVMAFLKAQRANGRPIWLVTASHVDMIGWVRDLFPFDGVMASTKNCNLKGPHKALALIERFGEQGFDYIGDARADVPVWQAARHAMAVATPDKAAAFAHLAGRDFTSVFHPGPDVTLKQWSKGLRLHQWSKNLLLGAPLIAGHHFTDHRHWLNLILAFISMGLCASASYLWNDFLDLEHDRAHPWKRHRLAASGRVHLAIIIGLSFVMMTVGLSVGFYVNSTFGFILLAYLSIALSYSLLLKRIPIADICVLAFLYLSRFIAGIVLINAKPSFWLFSFTFLFFLSLAAAKRFVEVKWIECEERGEVRGRGYRACDIPLLSSLGVSSGIASVVVFALYTHSGEVASLYRNPMWLWALCVLVFYWIARFWMLTHRNEMHDDPVVFALKDIPTWGITATGVVLFVLAGPI